MREFKDLTSHSQLLKPEGLALAFERFGQCGFYIAGTDR